MLFAAALIAVSPGAAAEGPALARLAEIGPWPAVSSLIGYRGRVWFANSVKFEDHNSADIYSYDPRTGRVRYETHLFSQDAGEPTVHRGLLYWPFEDPRWTTGRGAFMATDGHGWEWGYLPEGQAFHIHAMASQGDELYAATSAWRAGLQVSRDAGARWRIVHEHDNPESEISRMLSLAPFQGRLHAGLSNDDRLSVKLLRLATSGLEPVPGWPPGHVLMALTPWRGHLYGIQSGPEGRRVLRTDGVRTEPVTGLDEHRVRDLAAGPKYLWAITARAGRGALWRSGDGMAWQQVRSFDRQEPFDLLIYGSAPYVGTMAKSGPGALWGPPAPAAVEPAEPAAAPLPRATSGLTAADVRNRLAALDRLLADPAAYARHGPEIRAVLRPLAFARRADVGTALTDRLARSYPAAPVAMFGGKVTMPRDRIARWYLLWAIAMNRHGRIAPAMLAGPWRVPQNRPEKYLEALPGAIWAAGWLKQKDDETLVALLALLEDASIPLWLKGDAVGALTTLTGERFGYDFDAWRGWGAKPSAIR